MLSDGSIGVKLLPDLRTLRCRVLSLTPPKCLWADHQLVCAKRFLVEEYVRTQTERTIEILIHILGIRGDVNAQLADQALGDRAVWRGTLDGKRAAESNAKRIAHTKFIALGVAAKVVVVIKNENARALTHGLAIEVGSSESADASAHDDEVIEFAGIFGLAGGIPEGSVAQRVRRIE